MYSFTYPKFIIKKYLKYRTFKNIGFLTIGQGLSQIISLIGAFYIPSLLGLENYGIYNTVIAYVGMFTVLTFSGLNKVIIREAAKDTSRTQEILEATIGLRILFSILATFIAIITVYFVSYDFGTKIYIIIYSFSLLFKGAESSINTVFQANQKMKILGIMATVKQIILVSLSILFLWLGFGVLYIIILHLSVEAFVALILWYQSKKIIVFRFFSKIKIISKYIVSGFRFSLLEFFNVLSGKVDLVMLSFLTTPENVAIYSLAYRLVDKGLVLRTPISQSLFPYYSEKFLGSAPKIKELIKHTLLITIPLLVFLLPAIFLIKPIINNIIGKEFIESAKIFSVLVFYLIFNFSVIPWGLTLQTTSNEKYNLYTVFLLAIINISLNIIFFNIYGIIGIAYSTLLVEASRLILLFTYTKKYVIQ